MQQGSDQFPFCFSSCISRSCGSVQSPVHTSPWVFAPFPSSTQSFVNSNARNSLPHRNQDCNIAQFMFKTISLTQHEFFEKNAFRVICSTENCLDWPKRQWLNSGNHHYSNKELSEVASTRVRHIHRYYVISTVWTDTEFKHVLCKPENPPSWCAPSEVHSCQSHPTVCMACLVCLHCFLGSWTAGCMYNCMNSCDFNWSRWLLSTSDCARVIAFISLLPPTRHIHKQTQTMMWVHKGEPK